MKWIEGTPAPGKACGACTLCCKLFEIDWLEAPKPAGQWCQHCTPGRGCGIWQNLPAGCATYFCVWRLDPALTESWRPDRARFILTHAHHEAPLAVLVDPGAPDAHRKEPYRTQLAQTARGILEGRGSTLVVFVGAKRFLLFPDMEVPIPDGVALHEIVITHHKGPQGPYWRARFPQAA